MPEDKACFVFNNTCDRTMFRPLVGLGRDEVTRTNRGAEGISLSVKKVGKIHT
jgi:hypothetical protein